VFGSASPAVAAAPRLIARSQRTAPAAPACGTVLATAFGVPAFSNGPYMGTGTSCASPDAYGNNYQCPHYVRRVDAQVFGVDTTQPAWRGNGADYESTAAAKGLTFYPNGSTSDLRSADIMIFGAAPAAPFGHVASVNTVSANSVILTEQNWSFSGLATLPITRAASGNITIASRGSVPVAGWARPSSASPCASMTVAPTSLPTFAAVGGNGALTITASATCSWTATTTNSSMIVFSGSTSGSGGGSVSFTVAANANTTARSAAITIGNTSTTVNQAAAAQPTMNVRTERAFFETASGVEITVRTPNGATSASFGSAVLSVGELSASGAGTIGPFSVVFKIGTTEIGRVTGIAMNAGDRRQVQLSTPWTVGAGENVLRVELGSDIGPQTNTNDDYVVARIEAPYTLDLVAVSVSFLNIFSPGAPFRVGDTIEVKLNAQCTGGPGSTPTFPYSVYIDGVRVREGDWFVNCPTSFSINQWWVPSTSGNHTISWSLDTNSSGAGFILESGGGDGNHSVSTPVTIQ